MKQKSNELVEKLILFHNRLFYHPIIRGLATLFSLGYIIIIKFMPQWLGLSALSFRIYKPFFFMSLFGLSLLCLQALNYSPKRLFLKILLHPILGWCFLLIALYYLFFVDIVSESTSGYLIPEDGFL